MRSCGWEPVIGQGDQGHTDTQRDDQCEAVSCLPRREAPEGTDPDLPDARLLAATVVRKEVAVRKATQSVALGYGSASELTH